MSLPIPEIPRRLYPAMQVRELDRIAIEEKNIAGIELMERAGKSAWRHLKDKWPRAEKIIVVCGAGNNAGDGYVVARCGLEDNKQIEVLALADPMSLKGDARHAAENYLIAGQAPHRSISGLDLQSADVIVDAMLGTGLDRMLTGDYLETIRAINETSKPVLAIDIPSGLHADTGMPMGAAIRAELTVSFIGQKQGLYIGLGAGYGGDIRFEQLLVPEDIYTEIDYAAELVDVCRFQHLLAKRSRTGHKGNYGHVLVVGGEYGMAGAVSMCAQAATRTGAGLVSIASRLEHAVSISAATPELMALGVNTGQDMNALLERATVVALGPGLGQSDWSSALFSRILDTRLALVVDADALNLLAQDPLKNENWVLTPHPGEAARLLGCKVKDLQADRLGSVSALQQKYGGVIVLKGPGTIINGGAGRNYVCSAGNPGMATGGMGDILTGIIAGLLAQGLAPEDAAALGVCIHARAGDLSAAAAGERGMMATDLLPHIRRLVNPSL